MKDPVSFFKTKIMKMPEVRELKSSKEEASVFQIYIDKPDWDLEEKIYEAYGQLLDNFPDLSFDLRVIVTSYGSKTQ